MFNTEPLCGGQRKRHCNKSDYEAQLRSIKRKKGAGKELREALLNFCQVTEYNDRHQEPTTIAAIIGGLILFESRLTTTEYDCLAELERIEEDKP